MFTTDGVVTQWELALSARQPIDKSVLQAAHSLYIGLQPIGLHVTNTHGVHRQRGYSSEVGRCDTERPANQALSTLLRGKQLRPQVPVS